MSRRQRRPFGVIVSAAMALLVGSIAVDARAPAPVYRENHTRTYRFKARITNNSGVTPFKVGERINGSFTYDLRGERIDPESAEFARYRSRRNAFAFQSGDLRFTGTGDVALYISVFEQAETFWLWAPDLRLPKGWQMDHTLRSQAYGISFQNAPPRKALRGVGLPDRLRLADFVSSHVLRLDFGQGVRFPGGKVDGRATVYATLESLE